MTIQAAASRQALRAGAQTGDPYIRQPAVAGRFYPANGATLAGEVNRLLAGGSSRQLGKVRALVAPHAGYACSGEVAAAAYHTLAASMPQAQQETESEPGPTVYLLGPAHWKAVHGVGLSGAAIFATPLGHVPVATGRLQQLAAIGGQYHIDDAAHAPEHCLEVHLPFLQAVLAAPRIVPMLFDDGAVPEQVAGDLCRAAGRQPRRSGRRQHRLEPLSSLPGGHHPGSRLSQSPGHARHGGCQRRRGVRPAAHPLPDACSAALWLAAAPARLRQFRRHLRLAPRGRRLRRRRLYGVTRTASPFSAHAHVRRSSSRASPAPNYSV